MSENEQSFQPTHYAFSDESNWNNGRFRSVALVTTTTEHLSILNNGLTQILNDHNFAKEFKWSKLTEARKVDAANELLKFAFDNATHGHLKIATIIWDTNTEWYKTAKIENTKNSALIRKNLNDRGKTVVKDFDELTLNQMYIYIYRCVLTKSWPSDSIWHVYPDEQNILVWETLQRFLNFSSPTVKTKRLSVPSPEGRNYEVFEHRFNVKQVTQAKSDQTPLIQLADLFAGLGAFVLNQAEHYQEPNTLQLNFDNASLLSRSSLQRFKVLSNFFQLSLIHQMNFDLFHLKELETHQPFHPITFWLYKPREQVGPDSSRKISGYYYLTRKLNNNN